MRFRRTPLSPRRRSQLQRQSPNHLMKRPLPRVARWRGSPAARRLRSSRAPVGDAAATGPAAEGSLDLEKLKQGLGLRFSTLRPAPPSQDPSQPTPRPQRPRTPLPPSPLPPLSWWRTAAQACCSVQVRGSPQPRVLSRRHPPRCSAAPQPPRRGGPPPRATRGRGLLIRWFGLWRWSWLRRRGSGASCGSASAAGGGVGGPIPEEALATAGDGGSPAPTGPAA